MRCFVFVGCEQDTDEFTRRCVDFVVHQCFVWRYFGIISFGATSDSFLGMKPQLDFHDDWMIEKSYFAERTLEDQA